MKGGGGGGGVLGEGTVQVPVLGFGDAGVGDRV